MLIFCPTFYHMSMCLWHSWLRREKLVQVREVEGQARHNFESSSFSLPRCFHLLQCQEIGSSDRGNTQHKLARYVLALYLNLKTCKSSGHTEVCPSSVVEMQQIHHLGRIILKFQETYLDSLAVLPTPLPKLIGWQTGAIEYELYTER